MDLDKFVSDNQIYQLLYENLTFSSNCFLLSDWPKLTEKLEN